MNLKKVLLFILISCFFSFYIFAEHNDELNIGNQATAENEAIQETSGRFIGDFIFPLPEKYRYYVSSSQGLRDKITTNSGGTVSGGFHNGIDIAVPYGTAVYCAKDGYVVECYPGALNGKPGFYKGHEVYGSCILLKHEDGTMSLYAHLSQTKVRERDFVNQGDTIGLSGGTGQASGKSSGNHLHFSIYVDIADMIK